MLNDSATASLPLSVLQEGLENNTSVKLLPHSGKQQEQKNPYPARTTSLQGRRPGSFEPPWANLPATSLTVFDSSTHDGGPRSAKEKSSKEKSDSIYNHNLEQLAAQRAELYLLQRRILEQKGISSGWTVGWPAVLGPRSDKGASLSEVSLDDDSDDESGRVEPKGASSLESENKGLAVQAFASAMQSLEAFRALYVVRNFLIPTGGWNYY